MLEWLARGVNLVDGEECRKLAYVDECRSMNLQVKRWWRERFPDDLGKGGAMSSQWGAKALTSSPPTTQGDLAVGVARAGSATRVLQAAGLVPHKETDALGPPALEEALARSGR